MRFAWLAVGACAGLAACAPAGYSDGYDYSSVGYGYGSPGYGYAYPYGYAHPYGYASAPAVVGVWGGGRTWDRAHWDRERWAREQAFRGVNPNVPQRAWAGGGRVMPGPRGFDRRPPAIAQETPRAPRPPRGWP